MKKILGAIILCTMLCCGLFAMTSCGTKENPFKVDAAYYSQTGCFDPAKYGSTVEKYFKLNPDEKEENLTDNDEIDIFVFMTLNANEKGDDIKVPTCNPSGLNLTLKVGDSEYSNNYNLNQGKFYGYWDDYKTTSSRDKDVLYAGGGENVKIVGLFSVRYHDYKTAVEKGSDFEVTWGYDGSISAKFNANEIETVGSPTDIKIALRNK